MNELKIFNNERFGEVRTSIINGEPYFMLADVCRVLEIGNPTMTKQRLNKNGVNSIEVIDNLGRPQQATFINESNLYKYGQNLAFAGTLTPHSSSLRHLFITGEPHI